jgi:integrase
MENHWIENWLSLQENPRTRASYQRGMKKFAEFCKKHQFNGLDTIVQDYRTARDSDNRRKLSQYTDAWTDVLQEYTIWLKQHHAPATVKNQLAILQSFFKTARVPIEVDIPKRAYVTYPKQNLKRKTLRRIISRSTVRNKAIWLMLAESGLRPYTVTQIRWDWIKEDYLAGRVPMMIRIPQRYTKDVVGDRWSFVGSDGYDALREYLEPRLPLQDDDYVFVREPPKHKKKRSRRYVPGSIMEHREDPEDPLKLPGIPFTSGNLSATFSNTVRALNLDSGYFGKPGKVRLYCLKDWFRNHCKADYGYLMFWMCRSSPVDSHYNRDEEEHRKAYREAYPGLRVMEEPTATADAHREIQELKDQNKELFNKFEKLDEMVKTLKILGDPELREMAERQGTTPLTVVAELLRIEAAKGVKEELQKIKKAENNDAQEFR